MAKKKKNAKKAKMLKKKMPKVKAKAKKKKKPQAIRQEGESAEG